MQRLKRIPYILLIVFLPTLIAACSAPIPPAPWKMRPCLFEIPGPQSISMLAKAPQCVVGTYNLHGLKTPALVRQDLSRLSFVEVWTFQEINIPLPKNETPPTPQEIGRRAMNSLSDILAEGIWYVVFVPVNEEDGFCEGQAIVSRWPLKNPAVWTLEHTGKKDRIALACHIGIARKSLCVVNTDHEVNWATITSKDRMRQIRSLLGYAGEIKTPMVIAGDFNSGGDWKNFWNDQEENRQLGAAMGQHEFHEVVPPDIKTFHMAALHLRLDHIFTRGIIPAKWGTIRGIGSDHDPVWCGVEMISSP